jgi:cystathionine beta-lyase/cystathionine gamma-synthase
MGIDIVVHSASKYLGGHSDIIAGTVSSNKEMMAKIRSAAKLLGGTVDPFAAFLLDRGLKTLAVRVEKHNQNALMLAEKLSLDKRIRRVHYPGLSSHPNHEVAKKQMAGFGGMLSIDLDCCLEDAISFVDSLEIFLNAVSLGGVDSLACIPALTTHQGINPQTLEDMGISESTVRLSVGIEDIDDLYNDIISALDKILG